MKKLLLLVFCCVIVQAAFSQHNSGPNLPDSSKGKMGNWAKKRSHPFEGMLFPEFKAVTHEGYYLNNSLLMGKVCLLLFWDPWCGCFNPRVLGKLPEMAEKRKDFQIISMMWDTGRLAIYESQYDLPTTIAKLPTNEMMHELNLYGGIPSWALLDRNGIVVRVGDFVPGFFDERALYDKINELLLF